MNNHTIQIGDIVKWARKSTEYKIGVVCAYCDFQQLFWVVFADGECEIEAWCLEVLIKHNGIESQQEQS